MKYIVVLGDGMADYPVKELDGKTPLQVANKPNIDKLSKLGELGLVRTVPVGMKPGSDNANLSVMGYNPLQCYTGRSPLEALAMGLTLLDTDIAVRCNTVTLSDEPEYEDKTMIDYSAGEISTEESRILIEYVQSKLGTDLYNFNPGISYRHCFIMHDTKTGTDLTPPHDITGKKIKDYLPKGLNGELFKTLERKSYEILKDHPINKKRIAEGKNPANSIWFWGEGTKPNMKNFKDLYGVEGAVVCAVDLIKGLGIGGGMELYPVDGATGNYDTNFVGKADAALKALKDGKDFVYIHMEAPDECGHHGDYQHKIFSIEQIDKCVVKRICNALEKEKEDYSMLILPDHPTPIVTMTHAMDPVPYIIYRSNSNEKGSGLVYDEDSAKNTGIFINEGYTLMAKFLGK